ncbi:MAG TPA: hypothetical protein VFV38_01950 [Ktedonobacteraceae bacterium]|nr:hypothetical protein [Ktedonobacteraceae bacterium]
MSSGTVREQLQQMPTTLIHADLSLDDVLFPLPSHLSGMIVLDWQRVAREVWIWRSSSLERWKRPFVERWRRISSNAPMRDCEPGGQRV